MKIRFTVFVICLAFLLFHSYSGAQTRVDNPGRAMAKNAGRIVKIEEVLRIRDDGAAVIFKSPRGFALGPDNSLYFTDYDGGPRLYRFSPDGKLISNTLKPGQGPGEVQYSSGFLVTKDRVRVLAWIPPKIMEFSLDGRYVSESKVKEDTHGLWFLAAVEGKIYGIRDELFSSTAFRSSGVFSVPNCVYEISSDFKFWKKLYEFPVRMVIKRANAIRLDPIDAAIHGSTLYILHTAKYQVTEFDLHAGGVRRVISRAYQRVKGNSEKAVDSDPESRGFDLPSDAFNWDILKIHAAAGNLWVFTSALKPDGDDQQADIFDESGRFIDHIILRFPAGGRNHRAAARWTLLTDDGFLIIPEQEEDGLISIGKYRIQDPGLFR